VAASAKQTAAPSTIENTTRIRAPRLGNSIRLDPCWQGFPSGVILPVNFDRDVTEM
jgi:hypothetical protein